jgi:ABC-type enterochelin transport system permease subunit
MILPLAASVVWVDFFVLLLSRFVPLGKSLDRWYIEFGIVAVLSDCLSIVLGIMIAMFIFPNGSLVTILITSVVVQTIHDLLFYVGVIRPISPGYNRMIDVFKAYAAENSWKILVADSSMMIGTVLGMYALSRADQKHQWFTFLTGVYALTYVIYTRPL